MKEDLVLTEDFSIIFNNSLVYECKVHPFNFNNEKILKWKSTGIFSYLDYYSMKGIEDTKKSCQY